MFLSRYLALTALALCAPALADLETFPSVLPTLSFSVLTPPRPSISRSITPSLSLSITPSLPLSTLSITSISPPPSSQTDISTIPISGTLSSSGGSTTSSGASTGSGAQSTTSTGAARATGLSAEGFAMAGVGLLAAALI
ncbi:hypothetical protein C8J57DRAFT_1500547 [Mycena rebaudengoi]|nr:hypothetical protein C8J57DRAFT_1500547 [Mycena rebaudengoi]